MLQQSLVAMMHHNAANEVATASYTDILAAFRRAPQSFGASESKIKQVIQLLLSVEDISYIASKPTLLTYSVEKRLKPRLRVLNVASQ
ncbi:hypothetical protein M5689_000300 [Euphorbia peplus]|nr:hypothetical protein M5689_000300 [Euphorbia peplus]